MAWQTFFKVAAVCKAAIGGAGLALALLGAWNVAAAVSAHDWLTSVQHTYALDAFAATGGVLGAAVKLIFRG
jgi:hypothetical protein